MPRFGPACVLPEARVYLVIAGLPICRFANWFAKPILTWEIITLTIHFEVGKFPTFRIAINTEC